MSNTDKSKLNGIETGANNYIHPATTGNLHIPPDGASGQFLKWSADGTAVWATDNNTTYSVSDGGLTQINFTSTLNTKLGAIEASADVTDAANVASAGAVMDGDFSSNGFMKKTGTGTYTAVTAIDGTAIGSTTASTGKFTTLQATGTILDKDGDAGTSGQILSSTASGTDWIDASSGARYLGEEYLDGIIFYLYIGSDGLQHGLVVSKTETTATWSGSTLVGADRTEDGAYNTNLMPVASPARVWVYALTPTNTWYLPSIDELSLLWHNRYHVNKTARAASSTLLSSTTTYWSSTEYTASNAFYFYFLYGYTIGYGKSGTYLVRGVRAF